MSQNETEEIEKLTKPSEGYFNAKREMVEGIDNRMEKLMGQKLRAQRDGDYVNATIIMVKMETLENIRNYVRNVMLWDTRKGE